MSVTTSCRFLSDPGAAAFRQFSARYESDLQARFARDRSAFDALAERAENDDVYLGCNCPTRTNPEVTRCHTVLALRFMKRKYPRLPIQMPR